MNVLNLRGTVDMETHDDFNVDISAPLGRFHYDAESINQLIVQLPFEIQDMVRESEFFDVFESVRGVAYVQWGFFLNASMTVKLKTEVRKFKIFLPLVFYNINKDTIDFFLSFFPAEVKNFIKENDLIEDFNSAIFRLTAKRVRG